MAFLSSAGQTYFIGVFGPSIQAEFGLDAGSWGRTYMLGTLLSAMVINWSGSLIDRFDLRVFAGLSLLGLCAACLLMGLVSSPVFLVLAIFMLRQFGQGLTSHAGGTSMARYHDTNRGKALALTTIGYAFGEAMLPVLGIYSTQVLGWRQTFLVAAAIIAVSIPFVLWLLKGHQQRHTVHVETLDRKTGQSGSVADYTRRQMLSEARFYWMLPAMIAPSLIGTALFFFPSEMARAKGWSVLWVTGNYWLYSMVSVATTIYAGVLIDRITARRVVLVFLIPLGFALIVINLSDHEYLVWPYMFLIGITSGVYFSGFGALLTELYGPRHLGAIKSLANAVMVFSSALGPAFVGSLLNWNVEFGVICLLMAGFCAFATATLTYALRIPWR